MRLPRWNSAALIHAAIFFLLITNAMAQDTPSQATLGQIQAQCQETIGDIEAYSYKKAEQKLEKALNLANTTALAKAPQTAQVHLMLGIVAIAGSNDLYRGLHWFVQALRIDPKISIPAKLITPQLKQMLAKAHQTVKEIRDPPTIKLARWQKDKQGDKAKKGTKGSGLVHTAIDSAKRGYPIPVKAETGIDIQAHKVFLFYRPAGVVKFNSIAMLKSGTTFRIAIPEAATRGRYIHYYIEARDKRGRLAASFGSDRSPTVIIIQ